MLSSVLKSERAAAVNVAIMRAFVAMRQALMSLGSVLARVESVECRQIEYRMKQIADQSRNEERFDTIFKAMDGGEFPPQKVFFDGRHYCAVTKMDKMFIPSIMQTM